MNDKRGKTAALRLCKLIAMLSTHNPDRPWPIPIKIPETTWPPVPELLAQPEHSNKNTMIAANAKDTFIADYSFQILRVKVEVAIFKAPIPFRLNLLPQRRNRITIRHNPLTYLLAKFISQFTFLFFS